MLSEADQDHRMADPQNLDTAECGLITRFPGTNAEGMVLFELGQYNYIGDDVEAPDSVNRAGGGSPR